MLNEKYSELVRLYLDARDEFCKATLDVINRVEALAESDPSLLRQGLIETSGIKRESNSDVDFETQFEEEMDMTIDEYINFATRQLETKINEARGKVETAKQVVPNSFTEGLHGTAQHDFQTNIHMGIEPIAENMANYLPKDDKARIAYKSCKTKYHDAATYVVHPKRAEQLAEVHTNVVNNGSAGPKP